MTKTKILPSFGPFQFFRNLKQSDEMEKRISENLLAELMAPSGCTLSGTLVRYDSPDGSPYPDNTILTFEIYDKNPKLLWRVKLTSSKINISRTVWGTL